MPNPWTGKGNPYTRKEVIQRLRDTLKDGKAIIAAGAGTGISAKFIERGGAALVIIFNSGRFRMAGLRSTPRFLGFVGAKSVGPEKGGSYSLSGFVGKAVLLGEQSPSSRRAGLAL